MYKNIATRYKTLLAIYFNDYNNIAVDKKVKIDKKGINTINSTKR